MKRAKWVKRLLVLPVMAAVCADSPAPGCGQPKPERGSFSCTMIVTTAVPQSLPCTGEWLHWRDDPQNWQFSGRGTGDGLSASFSVQVGSSAAPGSDLAFGTGLTGWAAATTPSGGYAANAGGGGDAHLVLASLSPPSGSFTAVLVPSPTSTSNTPGPAGTSVALDVSF